MQARLKTFFRAKVALSVLFLMAAIALPVGAQGTKPGGAPTAGVPILTYHGDNARLGWNAHETALTPERVASPAFGKLWDNPLDGFVNGSPLYVPKLTGVRGIDGAMDVVFAATVSNSIFALNAADGKVLWEARNLSPTLTAGQFNGSWNSPEKHGILSTPVIDRERGAIYVCIPKVKGLRQVYQAWGVDLRTGSVLPGWPVTLDVTYKGTRFHAGQVMQRGALTIHEGWLYVCFGGRGDVPPWRGWLIGIDTKKPTAPQRGFCTSPVSDGAGVWSAGGVSVAPGGELFAVTGNGDFDIDRGGDNLAQTVLRLRAERGGLRFSRTARDYYTPSNYKFLDEQDEDMGGATALVLPDLPGCATPRLLFTGGKDGCAYLLNRDRLGGLGGQLQRTRLFSEEKATYHEGIRATAAYFDSGKERFLYVPGDQPGPEGNLGLTALRLVAPGADKPARFERVWTLKTMLRRPTAPFVTSDGPRGGVVWLVEPTGDDDEAPSALRAYDALTGKALYNSDRTVGDKLVGGRKFVGPSAADGRVLIGARGVFCYGIKETRP